MARLPGGWVATLLALVCAAMTMQVRLLGLFGCWAGLGEAKLGWAGPRRMAGRNRGGMGRGGIARWHALHVLLP